MRWAAVVLLATRDADTDTSSSTDEVQSMLGALLESMSFAISQLYADRYDFLRTRAWYGNRTSAIDRSRPGPTTTSREVYSRARSARSDSMAATRRPSSGRRSASQDGRLTWPSSSTPRRRSSSSGPSTRTSSG